MTVFSCEFCKISKNTFFTEHIWATAFREIFAFTKTRKTKYGASNTLYVKILSWLRVRAANRLVCTHYACTQVPFRRESDFNWHAKDHITNQMNDTSKIQLRNVMKTWYKIMWKKFAAKIISSSQIFILV